MPADRRPYCFGSTHFHVEHRSRSVNLLRSRGLTYPAPSGDYCALGACPARQPSSTTSAPWTRNGLRPCMRRRRRRPVGRGRRRRAPRRQLLVQRLPRAGRLWPLLRDAAAAHVRARLRRRRLPADRRQPRARTARSRARIAGWKRHRGGAALQLRLSRERRRRSRRSSGPRTSCSPTRSTTRASSTAAGCRARAIVVYPHARRRGARRAARGDAPAGGGWS